MDKMIDRIDVLNKRLALLEFLIRNKRFIFTSKKLILAKYEPVLKFKKDEIPIEINGNVVHYYYSKLELNSYVNDGLIKLYCQGEKTTIELI